jgi:hypothetical protein
MQYILTGFTHDSGFRVFAFECVGKDRVRTKFQVRADLSLIKKYGIRVQDLPILCLGVLERRNEGEEKRTFTYTEVDMRLNSELCASQAAAAKTRKAPRRPPSENVGAAWRGTQL